MKTKAAARARSTNAASTSSTLQLAIQIVSPAVGAKVPVMPGGAITVSGDASPSLGVAVSLKNNTTGASSNGNCNSDAAGNWSAQLTIADPSKFPGNSALSATVNPPDGPSDGRNIQIVTVTSTSQMKRKSKPKVKPR
jgi:hypothetical protein